MKNIFAKITGYFKRLASPQMIPDGEDTHADNSSIVIFNCSCTEDIDFIEEKANIEEKSTQEKKVYKTRRKLLTIPPKQTTLHNEK
jgi:hypothetical protein